MEPVISSGGFIMPPIGWLRAVRAICDELEVLMIADEVITGFGRTGRWFAVEHDGIVPDLMTVAKGITSGYIPLSAAIARGRLADAFPDDAKEENVHPGTYAAHPVACAAALANIQIMEKDHLIENAEAMGARLRDGLQQAVGKNRIVGEVRGRGLLVCAELVEPDGSGRPLDKRQSREARPDGVGSRRDRLRARPGRQARTAALHHARGSRPARGRRGGQHRRARSRARLAPSREAARVVDPRAGMPAEPAMLANIPRLMTAYYTTRPDPSRREQRVAFGTSGHRGSALVGSFNEAHILAITQAICEYRRRQDIDGPLFLGIDTHALSESAFASALEVLAAHGVDVMIDDRDGYTPTPVISHAILTYNRGRTSGLADGIVVTPSHNPPEDGGFKYNPPHGGPADTHVTGWIQDRANALLADGLAGVERVPFERARRASTTHRFDYMSAYVADLGSVVDLDIVRGAQLAPRGRSARGRGGALLVDDR